MAGIFHIELQVLQKHTAVLTSVIATNPSLFGQHLVQCGLAVQTTVDGIVNTVGFSDYEKGGKLLGLVNTKIGTTGNKENYRRYFDDVLQIIAYTLGHLDIAESLVETFKSEDPSYTSPLQAGRDPLVTFPGNQQLSSTSGEFSHDEPVMYQPESSRKSTMSVEMIRANEDQIKAIFSSLLLEVQSSLEATSKIDKVRQFLLTFFKCSLPETSSYNKLFEEISLKNLWTYQHHSPVEKLMDKFLSGDEGLKGLMRSYKACLSGFYFTTKLVDYMESKKLVDDTDDESDNQQPPVLSPKQYRRLKVVLKLERKITELSLEYVHKVWCSFAEEYDIPSLTVVLERVAPGSLEITWLIPTYLAEKIVPRSKFFREHGIVRVSLDNEVIYDEEEMADYEVSFLELYRNIETADISLFPFFLKKGVDPNIIDRHGLNLLFYAIHYGRQDLVELVIEHGADVDLVSKDGWTPLTVAVRKGDYAIVDVLLSRGANVNLRNKKGVSPLWYASCYGRSDIASLLLQHQAEVDLPSDDEFGTTPLIVACVEGHFNVATVLVQNGAVVDYESKKGSTPLSAACHYGYTELVDLLLSCGADVNKGLMPPLYRASGAGHVDIVKLLVSRGAEIDRRSDDKHGATPLIVACGENRLEVVSFLIKNGADVNLQTKNRGFTPLHVASQSGHTAVMKLLLKSGAQLDIKNTEGRTPLMLASWKGQLETVIELVRGGAQVNTQDQEGLTSLILAAQNGHFKVVETLLDAKADPDITENTAGWSAVFFAAKSGCLEIIQRLLRERARVDIEDKNGLTPDEVTDQQDIHEEIKRHSFPQSETETTKSQPEETEGNSDATPSESKGESPDMDEIEFQRQEDSDGHKTIEVHIQDEPKVMEEKKRRDLVKESYQRLLKIFDVLEDSLLPSRKEKKLHQQRKEMHSNIYEANQELALNA